MFVVVSISICELCEQTSKTERLFSFSQICWGWRKKEKNAKNLSVFDGSRGTRLYGGAVSYHSLGAYVTCWSYHALGAGRFNRFAIVVQKKFGFHHIDGAKQLDPNANSVGVFCFTLWQDSNGGGGTCLPVGRYKTSEASACRRAASSDTL